MKHISIAVGDSKSPSVYVAHRYPQSYRSVEMSQLKHTPCILGGSAIVYVSGHIHDQGRFLSNYDDKAEKDEAGNGDNEGNDNHPLYE